MRVSPKPPSAHVFQFGQGSGGSLSALSPASVPNCAGSHQGTGGVVISPDGKSVYAFCGTDSIEQYDVGSGGGAEPEVARNRVARRGKGKCSLGRTPPVARDQPERPERVLGRYRRRQQRVPAQRRRGGSCRH